MLFMLRGSVEMMLLAVAMPLLWGAVVVIAVTALVIRQRNRLLAPPPRHHVAELLSLAIAPILMLVWGLAMWPPDGRRPEHPSFALGVLNVLGLCQLSLSVCLVWRHRSRLARAMAATCIGMWWAAGALFTASMAVTNTWL
jgi:hypothetical protein